jgi:hypothetical protein
VIGMAMGDHGALDRPHRIDVEVTRLAAQPGGNRHQDVLRTHLSYIGGAAAFFSEGMAAGRLAMRTDAANWSEVSDLQLAGT